MRRRAILKVWRSVLRFITLTSALILWVSLMTLCDSVSALDATPKAMQPLMDALIERYVPEKDVQRLVSGMVDRGTDAGTIQSVLTTMRQAVDEGLPFHPLMEKAFEGLAKGVDPPRIQDAVLRVAERYRTAYRYVNSKWSSDATHRLGEPVAEAIAVGLNIEQIDATLTTVIAVPSSSPKDERTIDRALKVLKTARNLAALGISPSLVEQVLVNSLRDGFPLRDIQDLPNLLLKYTPHSSFDPTAARLVRLLEEGRGKTNQPIEFLVDIAARYRHVDAGSSTHPDDPGRMGTGKGSGTGSSGSDGGHGSAGGGGGGSGGGGGGGGGGR